MESVIELLSVWLRCQSCGSGDVTIALSFPGGISVACDDCRRRDYIEGDGGVQRGQPADHHSASDE